MATLRTETTNSPALASQSTFVIVGGGIAGVSCAEQLALLCPEEKIALVTASPLVKAASNVEKIAKVVESFDVVERPSSYLGLQYPNVSVVEDVAVGVETDARVLVLQSGRRLCYDYLCLCTGARPQLVAADSPYVLGIRDTETVQVFQEKLQHAKRLLVVGNGGIAIELVYELQQCEVIWAVRHGSVGATFFDPGAAHFFLEHQKSKQPVPDEPLVMRKRTMYQLTGDTIQGSNVPGSALGPDWASGYRMKGESEKRVHLEYNCEIRDITTREDFLRKKPAVSVPDGFIANDDWPVYVTLSNGKTFGCDLVVSATGVRPNSDTIEVCGEQWKLSEDSGIAVDHCMRTSVNRIYAAGDVCGASWPRAELWFQMRLWTQARHMGQHVAICMAAAREERPDPGLDVCFDLFTHVTRFFGFKVVLLGLFNGQGLGSDYRALLRVTPGREYVKALLRDGRLVGAVLVGETDLEETFENLMLGGMDLSSFGDDFLDPAVDLEEYFD